jgi:predicted acyl esterase
MRDGVHLSTDVMPGNAYKITLSDMVTGIRFPTGHRIRLDISSSDFPNDDRNQIITMSRVGSLPRTVSIMALSIRHTSYCQC